MQESKGERRSTPKAFSPFLALRTREGGEEETRGQRDGERERDRKRDGEQSRESERERS